MYHCIIAPLSNCPTDSHSHCFSVLKTHWPTASLSCCLTFPLQYSPTVLQYTLYIAHTAPKSRCPASTQPHCLTAPLLSSPSASYSLLLYHCSIYPHCTNTDSLPHCSSASSPHGLTTSPSHYSTASLPYSLLLH
jgi:hypothetical protein